MQIGTIGVDVAKNAFGVHGIDQHGTVVLSKRLARGRVLAFFANQRRCLIGLEAGGGGALLGASCRRSGTRRG